MVVPPVRRAVAAVKRHGAPKAVAAPLEPAMPAAPVDLFLALARAARDPTVTPVEARPPVAAATTAAPGQVVAGPSGGRRER